MMARSNEQHDIWRIATRENNLVWLNSFGCDISRSKHAIRIEHDELAEYCAWLVYGDDTVLLDKLRGHVAGKSAWTGGQIFVDIEAHAPAVQRLLREGHFDVVSSSTTYAAIVEPRSVSGAYKMRAAMPKDAERWAMLYVDGFSRQQKSAQDLSRWRRCILSSSAVRSWFLLRLGEEFGVVQTCHAHDVVGLYSLTLTEKNRNFATLCSVRTTLASHLTCEGDAWIYFELESPKQVPADRVHRGGATFNAVRVMSIYEWMSDL